MKNKQHEFIIKAFLESKIPEALREYAPQLIDIDSAIGGYCIELLKTKDGLNLLSDKIISENDKILISQIINKSTGNAKVNLLLYYRLAILTESILYQYKRITE